MTVSFSLGRYLVALLTVATRDNKGRGPWCLTR